MVPELCQPIPTPVLSGNNSFSLYEKLKTNYDEQNFSNDLVLIKIKVIIKEGYLTHHLYA